jgi:hypothetical protein
MLSTQLRAGLLLLKVHICGASISTAREVAIQMEMGSHGTRSILTIECCGSGFRSFPRSRMEEQ